ncbi:MAG TPA: DUF2520 domain-containing protein [Thermoanaerobaculia bacterium]|jgi:predicted short-subunit dehydrogenase-like oxidoreductase (DUF2520 family)|nr:DUF2520 domain-containing protein [Thermoanaerobaculia bacterium]
MHVSENKPLRLGILGGGRAAWAYGSSWRRIGWPIDGVWLRPESQSRLPELLAVPRKAIENLDADVLLIAVTDRAIAEVLCGAAGSAAIPFHASGATPAPKNGFSLHPLKSLPPVGTPSDLKNALLVFEGRHSGIAAQIANAIGARFAQIAPQDKPRYHAGAVFGSNYVAAMLDIAERLIGIENARDDIVALAQSAIDNWRAHTDARRFTGPAARGDQEVIERHVEALRDDPQVQEIYKLLAAEIARAILARQK